MVFIVDVVVLKYIDFWLLSYCETLSVLDKIIFNIQFLLQSFAYLGFHFVGSYEKFEERL